MKNETLIQEPYQITACYSEDLYDAHGVISVLDDPKKFMDYKVKSGAGNRRKIPIETILTYGLKAAGLYESRTN